MITSLVPSSASAPDAGPIARVSWATRAGRLVCLLTIILLSSAGDSTAEEPTALAERFLRGLYGCDPSVVDTLASDDIVVSYPIFKEIFGTPAIRGHQAVKEFATGFCSRWTNARITVHETVSEADKVVLIWSFAAQRVEADKPSPAEDHAWGGITLYRFDDAGRIAAEIGEESTPGPSARLATEPAGE